MSPLYSSLLFLSLSLFSLFSSLCLSLLFSSLLFSSLSLFSLLASLCFSLLSSLLHHFTTLLLHHFYIYLHFTSFFVCCVPVKSGSLIKWTFEQSWSSSFVICPLEAILILSEMAILILSNGVTNNRSMRFSGKLNFLLTLPRITKRTNNVHNLISF